MSLIWNRLDEKAKGTAQSLDIEHFPGDEKWLKLKYCFAGRSILGGPRTGRGSSGERHKVSTVVLQGQRLMAPEDDVGSWNLGRFGGSCGSGRENEAW